MNIKVSVIMSIYNSARHLTQAVESILSQSFNDFEFIIIDDGSTDESTILLEEFQKKDARIKIIKNEKNIGLTKSLNKGIKTSTGVYIARMDADDVSHPTRLEEEVAFLEQHEKCALVGSWATIINVQGDPIRTVMYPVGSVDLKKVLIRYNPFFHSSILMRRSALESVGLYDEQWRFSQDYELYFRIAKQYEIANIPHVLISYRESGESITGRKNKIQIGFVIKAKLKALREKQYSPINYIYLIPSIFSWLLPVSIRRAIKKILSI